MVGPEDDIRLSVVGIQSWENKAPLLDVLETAVPLLLGKFLGSIWYPPAGLYVAPCPGNVSTAGRRLQNFLLAVLLMWR